MPLMQGLPVVAASVKSPWPGVFVCPSVRRFRRGRLINAKPPGLGFPLHDFDQPSGGELRRPSLANKFAQIEIAADGKPHQRSRRLDALLCQYVDDLAEFIEAGNIFCGDGFAGLPVVNGLPRNSECPGEVRYTCSQYALEPINRIFGICCRCDSGRRTVATDQSQVRITSAAARAQVRKRRDAARSNREGVNSPGRERGGRTSCSPKAGRMVGAHSIDPGAWAAYFQAWNANGVAIA